MDRIKVSCLNPPALSFTNRFLYLASYTDNDFSSLRSKIQRLPAVHKASLGALSQHLSLVASRSDGNGMGPQDLASAFALHVLGKGEVLQGSVDVRKMARVRFICILSSIHLFSLGIYHGGPH
jgi:hypothetical protein